VRDFPGGATPTDRHGHRPAQGDSTAGDGTAALRRDYVEQGLYQGQSLLVMDL